MTNFNDPILMSYAAVFAVLNAIAWLKVNSVVNRPLIYVQKELQDMYEQIEFRYVATYNIEINENIIREEHFIFDWDCEFQDTPGNRSIVARWIKEDTKVTRNQTIKIIDVSHSTEFCSRRRDRVEPVEVEERVAA
jgi:hypothetical protein